MKLRDMKKLFFLLLMLLQLMPGIAQFQLVPIKPMNDDVQIIDIWHINLILNGKSDFTDYFLELQIYKSGMGNIYHGKTRTFNLGNNNSIFYLSRYNINTYLDYNTVNFPNTSFYSDLLSNYGYLPQGTYQAKYILYGKSESPGNPHGTEKLLEEEMEFEIGMKYPPHLVYPYDEDTIDTKFPTLTWIPPYPVRQGQVLTFDLKIVKIDSGQTPTSALYGNTSFYSSISLYNNYLPYPLNAPELLEDQPYAWQIKAYVNGQPAGETEIWSFVYAMKKLKNRIPLVETGSHVELKENINKVPVYFVESIKFYFFVENFNSNILLELYEDKSKDSTSIGTLSLPAKQGDNFYSYNASKNDSLNMIMRPLFNQIEEDKVYLLKAILPDEHIKYLRFEFINK